MFIKFLSFPNYNKKACVKGKGINCGAGYGLEILVEYTFYEKKKQIKKLTKMPKIDLFKVFFLFIVRLFIVVCFAVLWDTLIAM